MSAKMKLTGYNRELFIVNDKLAYEFAHMLEDKKVVEEFKRFHETQRSGWADDTIIKDFKRRFESARTESARTLRE